MIHWQLNSFRWKGIRVPSWHLDFSNRDSGWGIV